MILYRGKIHQDSETLFSIENRGLQYSDSLFETMRFSNGTIFFWEEHYFRLMSSMRLLRMEIPMNFSMEFLEKEVLQLINKSSKPNSSFRIKILVWRNSTGKYKPNTNEVDYCIISEELMTAFYTLPDQKYEVALYKDHYLFSGMLSTLKSTSKNIQILASIFAQENGYENCLLVNEKKQIVEATNGNLFLVKDNLIKTPPLEDGCLKGVLRNQIIKICNQIPDVTIKEVSISPFELQKADELFITNVISGIQSITKYRKKQFTNEKARSLLSKLNLIVRK